MCLVNQNLSLLLNYECPGIKWRNPISENPPLDKEQKTTNLALVNDSWFNSYFVIVSLNDRIATVELGNNWKYLVNRKLEKGSARAPQRPSPLTLG